MILHDPKDEQSWEAIKDVLVEDIFLTVHLTITPYIQSQVFATIERLEKMGVKNLSLSAKSIQDGSGLKESSDFATSKGLNLVWDIPVPYSAFNPFNLELENTNQAKGEGYAWLYIEPDGDVLPSQGVNTVLGNMLTDDWASIWANRTKPITAN
jgi:MoaA/NifB/PqqE/SkfB family radical SAM enzyme